MPSHCHKDGFPHNAAIMEHADEVDEFNRFTIPNDTNHPLLLPCNCHFSAESPAACNFRNDFANQCWVAIKQRCPHFNAEDQRIRRIQSKLRLLGYCNGLLNNNLSNQLSQSVISFKTENGLIPLDGEIPPIDNSAFFVVLEELLTEEAFGVNGSVISELLTDINS